MTHRFYLATVRGVYATHGEVFGTTADEPNPVTTWSDCGPLRGMSGPRIGFLRTLIEQSTKTGFNESEGAYYLNAVDLNGNIFYYFDVHRPARYDFPLPANATFTATLIDPIAMTQTPIPGSHSGKTRLPLPSKTVPCRPLHQNRGHQRQTHRRHSPQSPRQRTHLASHLILVIPEGDLLLLWPLPVLATPSPKLSS